MFGYKSFIPNKIQRNLIDGGGANLTNRVKYLASLAEISVTFCYKIDAILLKSSFPDAPNPWLF